MANAESPVNVVRARAVRITRVLAAGAVCALLTLSLLSTPIHARPLPSGDTTDVSYPADRPLDAYPVTRFNSLTTDVVLRTDLADAAGSVNERGDRGVADANSDAFDVANGFVLVQGDVGAITAQRVSRSESAGEPVSLASDVAAPSANSPPAIPLPPAIVPGLSGLAVAAVSCYRLSRRRRTVR